MIVALVSYASRATALVPNFGKVSAALFTTTLFFEHSFRVITNKRSDPTVLLNHIQVLKFIQSSRVLAAFDLNSKESIIGWIALAALHAFPQYSVPVLADCPTLVSFVQVAGEMVNIASKVVGSLATGVLVQKMVTGDTEGKIRFAVSTALLAFSAWNVKESSLKKPSPKFF